MNPHEAESPCVASPDGVAAALSEPEHDDVQVVAATSTDDKKDAIATSEPPRLAKPTAANQSQSPTGHAGSRMGALYVAAVVQLALLCLGWTLWLMILTASPTKTVNDLMDTSTLHFGAFWRLSESPSAVVGVGLAGLACVALGYVAVLVQIVFDAVGRGKRHQKAERTTSSSRFSAKVSGYLAAVHAAQKYKDPRRSAPNKRPSRHWSADFKRRASQLALDVLDRESKTRRNMHSLIKVADIAIQCVFLGQLMEAGMPVSLIGVFTASVALNAFSAAVMFALPRDNMGRAQLLVDTASDFVIAMTFPVLVLVYALSSFTFDQTLMAINAQTFPPAFFERVAAVVADPVEVTTVRRTLDSLRIDSVLKIFTRVGTSAALCRRFFGLADLLRAHHVGFAAFPNVYPKRHRSLATFFFAVAVAVVVITTESVRSSAAACAMHPECVQIARRWIVGRDHDDATRCPCLAMIDGNTWDKPLDRTEKLAQLAATSDLQLLQLVNRALPAFPDELRRCTNLQHVSLYYAETVVIPDWFAQFTQLEFLHVEGKSLGKSFHTLPDGLFDNMLQLTYLHFGSQALRKLPSFDELTDLRTLTLGALIFLTELPTFDRLYNLERVTVAGVPLVESFPDLTHVRSLRSLATGDRGSFCCNGFLGVDKCDLARSLCQPHLFGAPAVTQCLPADRVTSPATRAYFDKFAFSACSGEAARPGEFKLSPTREKMAQCNGTLYRACEAPGAAPGTEAMCYNARWMAVACDSSPFPIAMRRRQIALGRGEPCDRANEAWLGCR